MALKLGAVALAVILIAIAFQGLISGGSDGEIVALSRPGSIPTATLPATLSAPIMLGETSAATAGRPATGAAVGGGTYVVKSGDTLSAVATQLNIPGEQHAAWIAEVLRLNGIADARLLAVGQELTLPRSPTPAAAPARTTGTPAPATPTTAAPRTPTPPAPTSVPATTVATQAAPAPTSTPLLAVTVTGGGGAYTVASGDFPLTIAAKLGVPEAQQLAWAAQLLALNNLCASCLQVGSVLQLPAGTPSGGAPAPQPTPTPTRVP